MAKNCGDATTCGHGCHMCRYGSHCMNHRLGCHLACTFPVTPLQEQTLKDPVRRLGRKKGGKKK